MKHNYIGGEHLLLGLLADKETIAAVALGVLGVKVDAVRESVREKVGEGDEVLTGQIPFTPRAKRILELSIREALSLGHNYIGTEHILLGLVREPEGVAARILREECSLTAETVREQVTALLMGPKKKRAGARDGDLSVKIECEPKRVVTDKSWVEYVQGPRTTISIEGTNERVKPYLDAIQPLLDEMRAGSDAPGATETIAPRLVYIAKHQVWEDWDVLGVYYSREAAERRISKYEPDSERQHCSVIPFTVGRDEE